MTIVDLLNNAWFVGIAGGILSGLVVTIISRYFFSKRDSREYAQKIAAVNREIIYSIRSGISEGNIPSVDILESLITATCRKYGVNKEDVLHSEGIADELIKEVMDSSFITSSSKMEYCKNLLLLKKRPELVISKSKRKDISKDISYESRSRLLTQMSLLLGVTVGLTSILFTVFSSLRETGVQSPPILNVSPIFIPIVTGFVAIIGAFLVFEIFTRSRVNQQTHTSRERKRQTELNIKESLELEKEIQKELNQSDKNE
jgi:hypothetical protein